MTRANRDLIESISKQFVSQIKPGFLRALNISPGYFNSERTLSIEDKLIQHQDLSVLNRILDGVSLDTGTKQAFYDAVLQSQDPVRELLIPMIDTIAGNILTPARDNLKPDIAKDFKKYAELRKLYSDSGFHDVMLRAIGSACLANLTDFQTRKTKFLMATQRNEDQAAARKLNIQFTNRISGKFDSYLSTLNAEKFQQDLDTLTPINPPDIELGEADNQYRFVAMIIRALVYLVSLLSRSTEQSQQTDAPSPSTLYEHIDSPIESKIHDLSFIVQKVITTITPLSEQQDTGLVAIQKFAEQLNNLSDKIKDSREMEMEFELSVSQDFYNFCENLCRALETILIQEESDQEHAEVQRIISELTSNLRAESTTPRSDSDDSPNRSFSRN